MAVMGAGPSHALYFAAYEAAKEKLFDVHMKSLPEGSSRDIATPVWVSSASGVMATFFHDMFLNPFDGMSCFNCCFMCISHQAANAGGICVPGSMRQCHSRLPSYNKVQYIATEQYYHAIPLNLTLHHSHGQNRRILIAIRFIPDHAHDQHPIPSHSIHNLRANATFHVKFSVRKSEWRVTVPTLYSCHFRRYCRVNSRFLDYTTGHDQDITTDARIKYLSQS